MDRSAWPLFDLRVATPRVVLRYAADDDLFALADLALRGVHDPATMPFTIPWTDAEPAALRRGTLQWFWRQRAEWSVESWHLAFVVVVDGRVVGTQSIIGEQFLKLPRGRHGLVARARAPGPGHRQGDARRRACSSASSASAREYALTGAFHDNAPSLAVTRSLGYEEEGRRRVLRRDEPDWIVGYRLAREKWEPRRRDDIVIEGLEPCLDLFGLT